MSLRLQLQLWADEENCFQCLIRQLDQVPRHKSHHRKFRRPVMLLRPCESNDVKKVRNQAIPNQRWQSFKALLLRTKNCRKKSSNRKLADVVSNAFSSYNFLHKRKEERFYLRNRNSNLEINYIQIQIKHRKGHDFKLITLMSNVFRQSNSSVD